jgi:hypothetical protein
MRSSARLFCPRRNTRSVVKALNVTSSTEPTSAHALVQSSFPNRKLTPRRRRTPLLAKAVRVFRASLSWADIPADYDRRIRAIRDELGRTPAQFAERVGAARKSGRLLMGSTEAVSFSGVLAPDSGARPRRVSVRV